MFISTKSIFAKVVTEKDRVFYRDNSLIPIVTMHILYVSSIFSNNNTSRIIQFFRHIQFNLKKIDAIIVSLLFRELGRETNTKMNFEEKVWIAYFACL